MRSRFKGRSISLTPAYLDKLIAEATVDCYNESEQLCGIFTMLEEDLVLPFTTSLLGIEVVVERLDLTETEQIVAFCRRDRMRLRIPILDLPLPVPRPAGSEWIDVYRRWTRAR